MRMPRRRFRECHRKTHSSRGQSKKHFRNCGQAGRVITKAEPGLPRRRPLMAGISALVTMPCENFAGMGRDRWPAGGGNLLQAGVTSLHLSCPGAEASRGGPGAEGRIWLVKARKQRRLALHLAHEMREAPSVQWKRNFLPRGGRSL